MKIKNLLIFILEFFVLPRYQASNLRYNHNPKGKNWIRNEDENHTVLSKILDKYMPSSKLKLGFVQPEFIDWKDCLPAEIKKLESNGKVYVEWVHTWPDSLNHPSCTIDPQHLIVEI